MGRAAVCATLGALNLRAVVAERAPFKKSPSVYAVTTSGAAPSSDTDGALEALTLLGSR